jgi:ABC-type glycerol-3-phosphate transport system substrate-binding protein
MKGRLLCILVTVVLVLSMAAVAFADKYTDAANKHGMTAQAKEMYKWYAEASKPYRGKTVKTILEALPPSQYLVDKILPKFVDITGIKVVAELASNEEVYAKEMLEASGRTGTYDFFYDDQDMIGTWNKRKSIVNLTDFMKKNQKINDPNLDLNDFIPAVLNMYKDVNGNLWNLPMEQNLKVYLYRSDLLSDPNEMEAFKEKYGWDLRPAKTWDEYADIAEFFTRPDEDLYGHACVAKRFPGLAYEWTETLFLQPGACSKGIPWGRPISGWGIEIDKAGKMAGCSVKTGGTMNSPLMKEFFTFYKKLVTEFAPPDILTYTWEEETEAFAQGRLAQIPNYYSQLIPRLANPDTSEVVGKFAVGVPPVGKNWKEGMAVGYWDSSGFIIPSGSKNVEPAWLFAQFVVSKAHELERAKVVGFTVRTSVLMSPDLAETDERLGGVFTLERSKDALKFTGTDPAIEEYAAMLEVVYNTLALGYTGELTPDQTMDKLAGDMDTLLIRAGYPIK